MDFLNTLFIYLVLAASSIANIVKSSLGPVGLDKMLVDDVGVLQIIFLKDATTVKFQIFHHRMSQLLMMEPQSSICLKFSILLLKYWLSLLNFKTKKLETAQLQWLVANILSFIELFQSYTTIFRLLLLLNC